MADTTRNEPADDLIDLRALLSVLRRRLWAMVAAAALVFVLVVAATLQATPQYTATAKILLELRDQQVIDFESVISGLPPDSAAVDTEVEVIRSRALAEQVARELDLINSPVFNPELADPSFLSGLKSTVTGALRAILPADAAPPPSPEEAEQALFEKVVDNLMAATAARRAGLTHVINLSATTSEPRLSQRIANAYAEGYIVSQLEAKFEATEQANAWLNERVASLREEVQTREAAVAQFRDQAGLIDAEGATLTEQQISDVNGQLALQRADLAEAQARLENVRSQVDRGAPADTIPEVLRSQVIQELRRQQSEVAGRQADLSTRYGARHPDMVTVARELENVERQIQQEVQRIIASLQSEVSVARQRVNSLEASLNQLRVELTVNNSDVVRLRALQREAEASRALFESFLNRFRQTNETASLAEADARVVANAPRPASPSAPNVMLNLALGVVLAGVAAVGVAFALEMLEQGLQSEGEVEAKLGLPHIASMPLLKPSLKQRLSGGGPDPLQYVVDKPMSSFSESLRNIRSAIRLSNIDRNVKTVTIASALPGEGKTTLTATLGRISAMSGSSVVVVDCDLRRRLLTDSLAPDAPRGLLEVLNGEASIDEALVDDEATSMKILPLTKREFTPRDVFGSEAFANLLAGLRERFDLVLIDTAPVLAVSDTLVIAEQSDAVIYAARWRKTAVNPIRRALTDLAGVRANVLGVTLLGVDLEAQARYGYDNAGYYYRSYRKYYAD